MSFDLPYPLKAQTEEKIKVSERPPNEVRKKAGVSRISTAAPTQQLVKK